MSGGLGSRTTAPPGLVTLEVMLHEDEEPEWAEWTLQRNLNVGSDHEEALWIGTGTAPSLAAALDAANEVYETEGK